MTGCHQLAEATRGRGAWETTTTTFGWFDDLIDGPGRPLSQVCVTSAPLRVGAAILAIRHRRKKQLLKTYGLVFYSGYFDLNANEKLIRLTVFKIDSYLLFFPVFS